MPALDSGLKQVSDFIGRDLTPEEQDAVLEIVDVYTPSNEEGNLFGRLFFL
jgi:hypothetical protein